MKAKDYYRLLEHIAFKFLGDFPRQTLLAVCTILDKSTSESITQLENGEPDSLFLALLLFHLLFTAWPTRFFTGLDALCRTIKVPPTGASTTDLSNVANISGDSLMSQISPGCNTPLSNTSNSFINQRGIKKAAEAEQEGMSPFKGGESLF
jgi:hypothetical protein